jgi:transketolase
LYYGKILNFNPKNLLWENRDRFIVSKAHAAVSLFPILADLGFFDISELGKIGTPESVLRSIPDCRTPGFETINGSLGHGLGVACGMALALRIKKNSSDVFVVMGDGELYEGSVWEAIMLASQHKLDNLVLIIDKNKRCMLNYCKNIIDLDPLEKKFEAFGWKTKIVNGHDVSELYTALIDLKNDKCGKPKVLIADTMKGKGVPRLEIDPLCHIKSLKPEEVDELVRGMQNGE